MDDENNQLYKGPNGEALRIFSRAIKNNFQSEKHGKPIFDSALMVEVIVPGQQESAPEFELERVYCPEAGTGTGPDGRIVERSSKYDEYADAIAKFKAQNGEGLISGTPINQWPQIDAGTAATLRATGVYTVEMLANVSDGQLANLGIAGRTLREQARQFLNSREFGVPTAQVAAEVSTLRSELERVNAQLAVANAEVARLAAELSDKGEEQVVATPPVAVPTLDTVVTTPPVDPFAPPAPPPPVI